MKNSNCYIKKCIGDESVTVTNQNTLNIKVDLFANKYITIPFQTLSSIFTSTKPITCPIIEYYILDENKCILYSFLHPCMRKRIFLNMNGMQRVYMGNVKRI